MKTFRPCAIVLPPEVPKIHNEAGVVLPSHAGPYEEGGDLVLICVVTGVNLHRLAIGGILPDGGVLV
uniref:Uncharacterized protein n=1 Tax=Anopheles minimus TaxID=112268 RepID=A0A182VQU0_9DIPT